MGSFKNVFIPNRNILIKNIYFILFLFIFFIQIKTFNSQCNKDAIIKDGSQCFNRIIRFVPYYRAGQFTIRKDGVLFIEYSSSNKRLFYSLKINGRGYFPNDATYKEIEIQSNSKDNNNNIINTRLESKNILIYLSNDSNQENPYIFSVSSFKSLTELHIFDKEGNNSHKTWLTTDFFEIQDKRKYIFSHQFSLIEGYNNEYFAVYIQYAGTSNTEDYSNSYTISKFKFNDLDNRQHLKSIEFYWNYNNRIVSAFNFVKYDYLAVFFLKSNANQYTMRLHDLNTLEMKYDFEFYGIGDKAYPGQGIYFKALYLQFEYVAFIFFREKDNGKSLILEFLKIIFDNNEVKDVHDQQNKYKYINSYDFDTNIKRNEFYKINNEKLLFVSTIRQTKLILMFFETYNWYTKINTRTYEFNIEDYKITEELSVDYFNNFLMFTASVVPDNDNSLLSSFLLFFSYPNGTDFYLNISPFVSDSEYYSNENLITYLLNTSTIENNIFGYTLIKKIKLISIPEEIIFYREGSDIPLINDENINQNHILKQNKNIIKYNKNYTLDYQFMALDQQSNTEVFNQAHKQDIQYMDGIESDYTQKTYYGRVNRLIFSLCHEYCETCKELGISNDNQKCVTCLPQYTYDYFSYNSKLNIYPDINKKNCVPEGYFNKLSPNQQLVKCDSSNSKFYYNITDNNKKICFNNLLECPDEYPFLNETTFECLNYTPPLTTITLISTTIPVIPTTIPIIPTTLFIVPTTIQTTLPILETTFPIIPTTIQILPTTMAIIPTTLQNIETTINKNPSTATMKTTFIEAISTNNLEELPKEINNTAIDSINCLNGTNIIPLCSNITNEQIYSKLKKEIFDSYSNDKASKIYNVNNDLKLRVSNTLNEMNSINSSNDFSLIDLGECEIILKTVNNIPPNSELIILHIEKINTDNINYEIYNPITYEKLNLSICNKITQYIPFKLSEEKEKYYQEIIKQGYNPFDINDKFYREICTPYKSENGTDVLLDEREEFFYYPLSELMMCQNNCQYSSYSLDTKYVKCECGYNQTSINLDLKHISKDNILQSFLSTLTSTNYKVMKCYNLVFILKIFKKNSGSIITSILFILYFIIMIGYCIKKINSLKVEIAKILFNDKINDGISIFKKSTNKINNKKIEKEKEVKNNRKDKNKKNEFYPPKKRIKNKLLDGTSSSRKSSEQNLVVFKGGNKKNLKNNKISIPKSKLKSDNSKSKLADKNSLINYDSKNYINNLNDKITKDNIINEKEEEEKKNLDNFELNGLEYDEACELDKRGFCLTYWSVLMREHLFLFTFFSCTDYNLFYIKLERLITLICIEMTFNGLFFVHESMYGKYIKGEELTFVQKLPQLLFTMIISHIIELLLCFFGMTDIYIYEIKDLKDFEKNGKKVVNIIEKMKNKLIGFFIVTFLLFLFNWYFISAFCAVYQNTQILFLRDTAISFLTSMTDPFIIYGITVFIRYISLRKCCNKKLGCLYKISDTFPIF